MVRTITAPGMEDHPWVQWFEFLGRDNTDSTVSHYKSWGMRFQEWLDMEGREPDKQSWVDFDTLLRDGDALGALVEESGVMEPWDDHRPWKSCSPPADGYSYNTRLMALSAAKSWLDFRHEIEFTDRAQDKVHNVVKGETPPFDPVIAGPEEVRRVLRECEECDADACGTMARVGYDAVMRAIEITRVEWGDVDLDRGTIYVRAAKGGKSRHVRLSDRTLEELEDYMTLVRSRFDDPQYLFYSFYAWTYNKPWSRDGWSAHFANNHWKAGWHSFARHSAITNRLNAGESLSDVSRRARHVHLTTTQRYIDFVDRSDVTIPELE